MSPRTSNTIVWPSGETSTDDHVASLVEKVNFRASARGLLMSAAGSGFFFEASFGAAGFSCARAIGRDPSAQTRIVASRDHGFRIRISFFESDSGESADYLPAGRSDKRPNVGKKGPVGDNLSQHADPVPGGPGSAGRGARTAPFR